MSKPRPCACCSFELEPAQELRFLVECDNLDNPVYLDLIRRLPAVDGRPMPVCRTCQNRMDKSSRRRPGRQVFPVRSGLLAAVGLFTLGWLVQNFLLGPRE